MLKGFTRVFIKDQSGDILVLKDRKETWNLPGGKQEDDESPMECAIREVKEELALEISNVEEIFCEKLTFAGTDWLGHIYFVGSAKGKPTLNEPNKIKGVQFISDFDVVQFHEGLDPLFEYLAENKILDQKSTKWM